MTKKILMVGVLDVPSSTNVFMKKGFEQLGYEVEAYNYRTIAKKMGMFVMWDHFKKASADKRYDLILFCKTNAMHPQLLEHAKLAGPTWYWFMDPLSTAKATIAAEYAKYATYASATSSEVLEQFKKVNPNSFQIIEGYDPDIYFYEDLEKIYDVTFIGNATPQRANDIVALKKVIGDTKIHICGSGWPLRAGSSVYNEDERRVINQSKIVLNLCHSNIFSDRVVKSLACGALVMSQYCKDLSRMFPGFTALYETLDQAREIVELYMDAEKLASLKAVNIAMENMKTNYTWKAVCQSIIEKVK